MPTADRIIMGRPLRAAVSLLALTGLVPAACGTSGGPSNAGPSNAGTGTAAPTAMPPLPYSVPQRLKIGAIGVDAPIVPVGLDAEGRLETPPLDRPNLVGWYRGGPSPGQIGPAVLEGHVDSKTGPSVFYRLSGLPRGAKIEVIRADGSRVVFQADAMEQVAKDAFPTEKVYGAVDYAALRLITCGGTFNRATGHYEDNIIGYAHRIPT